MTEAYTYNQSLSENRAASVADTLGRSGIQNVVATTGCSYSNEASSKYIKKKQSTQ